VRQFHGTIERANRAREAQVSAVIKQRPESFNRHRLAVANQNRFPGGVVHHSEITLSQLIGGMSLNL
jgi:hypothetical protein